MAVKVSKSKVEVESREVRQTEGNATVKFIYDKVVLGALIGDAVSRWNSGETSGKFNEKKEGETVTKPALAYLDVVKSTPRISKANKPYNIEYKCRIIEPNPMKDAKHPQVFVEKLGFKGIDGNRRLAMPIERGILLGGEYVEIRALA